MKEQIHDMVHTWFQPEQLAIRHVRQPCYGMPIGGMGRRKSPRYAFQGQAGLYGWILRNVDIVIIPYEFVATDLPINHQARTDQKKADH
jgi:hypothetical protein